MTMLRQANPVVLLSHGAIFTPQTTPWDLHCCYSFGNHQVPTWHCQSVSWISKYLLPFSIEFVI